MGRPEAPEPMTHGPIDNGSFFFIITFFVLVMLLIGLVSIITPENIMPAKSVIEPPASNVLCSKVYEGLLQEGEQIVAVSGTSLVIQNDRDVRYVRIDWVQVGTENCP